MKTLLLSFVLTLFSTSVAAESLFEQLLAFNPNWSHYEAQVPKSDARQFPSEKAYIQTHLSHVLEVLRSNPTAHLTDLQKNTRAQLMEVLDGYRAAGIFPQNYYRNERIPVFIDEHDTHCAVGYLLQHTGNDDVARRISAADNYVWVKNITDPALPAWQKASGFSLEELKLIQGAYFSYREDAFYAPDKYEIPQKPDCIIAYFDGNSGKKSKAKSAKNVWIKGEGQNGVLNGSWVQNYSGDLPWIVGYYENGKRTGQWKEYYQGTELLCRTENWRNDKLNGVRKRFNRLGVLIEEIVFKDGMAMKKTNIDHIKKTTSIRTPIDSTLVFTEIYNFGGALLAAGHEKVHNPDNLQWFQNIELTALNYASISSRDLPSSASIKGAGNPFRSNSLNGLGGVEMYGNLSLVEYKKEGDWKYFREYNSEQIAEVTENKVYNALKANFPQFADGLFGSIQLFTNLEVGTGYDSLFVHYENDQMFDFYGYGKEDFAHLFMRYHPAQLNLQFYYPYYDGHTSDPVPTVKILGQLNKDNQKIGVWQHYTTEQKLFKEERFIIPQDLAENIASTAHLSICPGW